MTVQSRYQGPHRVGGHYAHCVVCGWCSGFMQYENARAIATGEADEKHDCEGHKLPKAWMMTTTSPPRRRSRRAMCETWKHVATWFFAFLMVTAIILGVTGAIYFNADHKRDLMRTCLAEGGNARTPADCHNGVYGTYR